MDVSDGRALPGFDPGRHLVYVDKGYCPAVHSSKAYCAQQEGHAGQHWGIYLNGDGTMRVYPRWD